MTIEDAASKYHWIKIADDGALELYLDHHALSAYRLCESYFELSILGSLGFKQLPWSLAFGLLWHEMMERFYKQQDAPIESWLTTGISLWASNNMEQFSENKMYKSLEGLTGFIAMLSEYAEHHSIEKERLRVVGTEIPFGKAKEVFLGEFMFLYYGERSIKVRCYLAGRLDFLMDNGFSIGPMDHKTSAFFRGNPADTYDPQEGMTGYVFAAREVVQKNFPELARNRKIDRIWMNFAQVTPAAKDKTFERFKRIPIFKTDWQLEQWRIRQVSTFEKVLNFIFAEHPAVWNTAICNNIYYRPCPYKNLHRQGTASNFFTILNTDFAAKEEWNPERPDGSVVVLKEE